MGVRTGHEYLEGLRDGRVVYVGSERVNDVTADDRFGRAAETVAALFDLKHDRAVRSDLVVDDGENEPYSTYFLIPRTKGDLEARARCHQRMADRACGLLGRAPDHVASLITGLATAAEVIAPDGSGGLVSNLSDYYLEARRRDAYVSYAVVPPRSADRAGSLRVVDEDDAGVVLRGVKALATAAVLADDIWIGNLQPLSPDQEAEAITCALPCNAAGLELWARRPFAAIGSSDEEGPLTRRFDEGDAVVICRDVKVGWDRVFVHRDTVRSTEIYLQTPAHVLANHQATVRAWSKVRFLVGVSHQIARVAGTEGVRSVKETMGRLAALEATISALVRAQIHDFERWPGGVSPNRRYVYATMNWCQESFPVLVDAIRELSGAGLFRYPAGDDVADAPDTRTVFESFWGPEPATALRAMELFKLAWDLVGSAFAGRQQQYERFYAGPAPVVRNHCYRETDWSELDALVDRFLDPSDRPPM